MWRILLIGALVFLFRRELRWLGAYWRSIAAMSAGAAIGLLYAGLLQRLGLLGQLARALGLGPQGTVLLVAAIGGIAGGQILRPVIEALFASNGRDRQ